MDTFKMPAYIFKSKEIMIHQFKVKKSRFNISKDLWIMNLKML